jgi:hypothetical protein
MLLSLFKQLRYLFAMQSKKGEEGCKSEKVPTSNPDREPAIFYTILFLFSFFFPWLHSPA